MPEAEHLEETSFDQAEGSIAYDYEVIHLLLSDNFLVHKRGAKLGFGWLFFVTHFKESVDFSYTWRHDMNITRWWLFKYFTCGSHP